MSEVKGTMLYTLEETNYRQFQNVHFCSIWSQRIVLIFTILKLCSWKSQIPYLFVLEIRVV